MKTVTISGRVTEIDDRGRAWLAGVTLDDKPLCSHMLLRPLTPTVLGGRVEIRCEQDARGRFVPCAE